MNKKSNSTRKSIRPKLVASTEAALYTRIRDLVLAARQTVARGVDLVQVHTNYEIGRHIVEHEQQGKDRAVYGAELRTQLSQSSTGELPPPEKSQSLAGIFTSLQKSQLPTGQSSLFSLIWTHYVFLLGIKDSAERSFYEIEATDQNWTVREVEEMILCLRPVTSGVAK